MVPDPDTDDDPVAVFEGDTDEVGETENDHVLEPDCEGLSEIVGVADWELLLDGDGDMVPEEVVDMVFEGDALIDGVAEALELPVAENDSLLEIEAVAEPVGDAEAVMEAVPLSEEEMDSDKEALIERV